MDILQLRDIKLKLNGKEIIKGVNLNFRKGEVHAVVGPNGAGKSTLAYLIMGLEDYRNIEGDIVFEGKSIKNLDVHERAKRGITLAWQEPARYEGLSIEKFILASAKERRIETVRKVLKKVGMDLEAYKNRKLDKTLSGGERKKIELASILAMKPKLVMLDEPDSGIDVASLENIFDAIKFLKEEGATIILITHSSAVLKQAENAFLICNGMVIEKGSVDKIIPYFENKCLPCDHKNIPMGWKNEC